MSRLYDLFGTTTPIIGVCHLPPLPDYAQSPGGDAILQHMLRDLAALEAAGLHGVLLENEGDRPHRILAAPATVAAMTDVAATAVRQATSAVVGCEILLNDPHASLDVARAARAAFIRSDYFVDRMRRPEYGEFAIDPQGLLNYRRQTGADNVLILADIQVKYATMIEARPLEESARLAVLQHADALVVSGNETGDAPSTADLCAARRGVLAAGGNVPVLIGSGFSATNAATLLADCDGAIVGTSLMVNGQIDIDKARALVAAVSKARA